MRLLDIQNNEDTFLKTPTQNVELYKDWLKEYKLSEYNGEINILLANNPKLREIYAKLVSTVFDVVEAVSEFYIFCPCEPELST